MTLTLNIKLSEIKYEVKFDSWHIEMATNDRLHESNPQSEGLHIAYNDDRAEDWLLRTIQDAMDTVYGELRWCARQIDGPALTNDMVHRDKEWTIEMDMEKGWKGSVNTMRSRLHRYVVSSVLARWLMPTSPNEAMLHRESANEHLTALYNEARSVVVKLEPWRL